MPSNVHKLDRRAVLTGAGATAVALAASTIPAEPAVSPLVALIKAHKRANAEWLVWVTRLDEESTAAGKLDHAEPILAEIFPGHHKQLSEDTDLAQEVADMFDKARKACHTSNFIGTQARAVALKELDIAEREARKRCAVALRNWRVRHRGYLATKRAYERTCDADRAAGYAILSYPCATVEENRIRAEYLLGIGREWPGKDLFHRMEADPDMLSAFIRSTAGMEIAA